MTPNAVRTAFMGLGFLFLAPFFGALGALSFAFGEYVLGCVCVLGVILSIGMVLYILTNRQKPMEKAEKDKKTGGCL